jgi:hypothetical protein
VIESDDESAGVWAECGSNNGSSETTDDGAEKKWSYGRCRSACCSEHLWSEVVNWILNMP